jgi:hypothetical protein
MYRVAIVITTVGLLLGACSSASPTRKRELMVRTKYESSTPFSEWKEFRMASVTPSDTGYTRYPRLEKIVRDALISELTARGYQRTDVGATDFRVSFELIFSGSDLPGGFMGDAEASPEPKVAPGRRLTGTLVIKMLDPTTSEVLWEGRGSGLALDSVAVDAQLQKAVWRVLVEFPPITG